MLAVKGLQSPSCKTFHAHHFLWWKHISDAANNFTVAECKSAHVKAAFGFQLMNVQHSEKCDPWN